MDGVHGGEKGSHTGTGCRRPRFYTEGVTAMGDAHLLGLVGTPDQDGYTQPGQLDGFGNPLFAPKLGG